MADYEINAEKTVRDYIEYGPKFLAPLAQHGVRVETAPTTGWAYPDYTFFMVATVACVLAFMTGITVFAYHRERIRRMVSGENRRVGSVYYVRPGISAFQPTEI